MAPTARRANGRSGRSGPRAAPKADGAGATSPARGERPARRPIGRPAGDRSGPAISIPLGCTLAEAERRIVLAHLRYHATRAQCARALGIGLRTLYTKLAAWGRDLDGASSA
jgi:DNA-binding NtrC family response regulator